MISNTDIKYDNTCHDNLALCSTSNKDRFWWDDPKVLYENDEYLVFIPTFDMTKNQLSNAISRLCFYALILLSIFNKDQTYLFIPITILILVILFNKINMVDIWGGAKELDRVLGIRDRIKNSDRETYSLDAQKTYPTYQERIDQENARKNYKLETGYYDSNGDMVLGTKEPATQKLYDASKNYTADELKDYKNNTCRMPTPNNPMMNLAATEWGHINVPAACNADDDQIKENIDVNFNHQLFRDVDEAFDKANSQRQFYTMPNTAIPNMQTEFAEWLFKQPEGTICKNEDMSNCLMFYEDIRYRSR